MDQSGVTSALTSAQIRIVQEIFDKHLNGLWVFGSRARGDHSRYSDLDLLIDPDIGVDEQTRAELKRLCEDSELPFKVDIVRISDAAKGYLPSILSERKLFKDFFARDD